MKHRSQQKWFAAGAFLAALAVAVGAVGAHLIKNWVIEAYPDDSDRRLDIWVTASRYQMYAAIGLMLIGMWNHLSARQRTIAGTLGIAGTIMFSGCLIIYVIADVKFLMAIVPVGGFCMIASWFLLGWFSLSQNQSHSGE